MLTWTFLFFILAIAAAVLGFTGLAVGFEQVAWVLFVLFLALFAINLVRGSNKPWR